MLNVLRARSILIEQLLHSKNRGSGHYFYFFSPVAEDKKVKIILKTCWSVPHSEPENLQWHYESPGLPKICPWFSRQKLVHRHKMQHALRDAYSVICSSDLTAGCAEIRDKEANSTNSSWTEFPQGKKGQTEKLWTYVTLTDSLSQQVNSGLKWT